MIDWLANAPLVDAVCDRARWIDDALLVTAGLAAACKHCLGARPICGADGRVRRTSAAALKLARVECVLAFATAAALGAYLALDACDLRASNGEAARHRWPALIIVVFALAIIGWSALATVATLLGKSGLPWTGKFLSDESVLWKQEAFAEYAKRAPYPGTSSAQQPAGR